MINRVLGLVPVRNEQMRRSGRGALALAGTMLAGGLLAAPAAADSAPPPVNIGSTGNGAVITVQVTAPGFGGSGGGEASAPAGSDSGGGGSSSSPVGSGGGGSSGGGSSGGGYVITGADNPARALGITDAQFLSAPGFYTRCTPATLPGADPALVASCLTGSPAMPAAPAAPGASAAPALPPPPSAAVVAQIAISQLNLTAATPHLSANPNLAVGLPVWMWVDQSPTTTGPVSTTATVGPTSVTAVATLSRIHWSMGPAGAVVSCAGPGTPAPAGPIFHGNNSPDCGFSYALRSLPERTGGTGKWPVSATAVWNITWFGAGQTGGQGLNLTSRTAVEVGELQSVFVAPGGGN